MTYLKTKHKFELRIFSEWMTSQNKIATIDENGIVTALKKGTVKITAMSRDGSRVKAVFTIKIKK